MRIRPYIISGLALLLVPLVSATYAPDGFYQCMASPAMDRFGNIGIGYSSGERRSLPGNAVARS